MQVSSLGLVPLLFPRYVICRKRLGMVFPCSLDYSKGPFTKWVPPKKGSSSTNEPASSLTDEEEEEEEDKPILTRKRKEPSPDASPSVTLSSSSNDQGLAAFVQSLDLDKIRVCRRLLDKRFNELSQEKKEAFMVT